MNLLLDTHALIWLTENNVSIASTTLLAITNPNNRVYISSASFYEIAIKINIGKLQMEKSFDQLYQQTINNQIDILPISKNYLDAYITLPQFAYHKDPFDRLLIATAMVEKLTIVTADKKFNLYKKFVNIVW
ncbi:MAG: type II toxin-antitoxin system VapC family toxin [Flavobacterium sp.]|nr:type II toxin-antitoxin system VapC family toxin [Flavobacterium sp.]